MLSISNFSSGQEGVLSGRYSAIFFFLSVENAAKTYRKSVDSTRISDCTRFVNSFTSDNTHEKCIMGCFNSHNNTPIFTVYVAIPVFSQSRSGHRINFSHVIETDAVYRNPRFRFIPLENYQ